jgi:hypothetical protein
VIYDRIGLFKQCLCLCELCNHVECSTGQMQNLAAKQFSSYEIKISPFEYPMVHPCIFWWMQCAHETGPLVTSQWLLLSLGLNFGSCLYIRYSMMGLGIWHFNGSLRRIGNIWMEACKATRAAKLVKTAAHDVNKLGSWLRAVMPFFFPSWESALWNWDL